MRDNTFNVGVLGSSPRLITERQVKTRLKEDNSCICEQKTNRMYRSKIFPYGLIQQFQNLVRIFFPDPGNLGTLLQNILSVQ